MADWVHCNRCFLQPALSNGIKYHLTNCGHIFCEKCIERGKPNVCGVCDAACNTILLSANLNPDVEAFFSDPEEMLTKYLKVTEFQKNNRTKLVAHLTRELYKLRQKYELAKDEIRNGQKAQAALNKDNMRLRALIKRDIGAPSPGGAPPPSYHHHHRSHHEAPGSTESTPVAQQGRQFHMSRMSSVTSLASVASSASSSGGTIVRGTVGTSQRRPEISTERVSLPRPPIRSLRESAMNCSASSLRSPLDRMNLCSGGRRLGGLGRP